MRNSDPVTNRFFVACSSTGSCTEWATVGNGVLVSREFDSSRDPPMKVISCRENEGLVIGEDIFVTVLQVRLNHVRLAISCSRRFPSYWEETLSWEPKEEPAEFQLTASRF
jgi:hypothetical protein